MLSSHTCLLIGILTLGIHFSGPAVCFPVKKDWSSADIIDSYNSMTVYDNGRMSNFFGRNLSREGYNLGLKYQCVELVKRYYYQIKNHRMPDSYGHAYMLFDSSLSNGHHNEDRNLTQYMNGSVSKPPIGDILVFGKNDKNRFGHLTLVRELSQNEIERIQQNVGKISSVNFSFVKNKGGYYISNESILGWLRKLEK